MQQSHELSPREREVMILAVEGKSNKQIAAAIGLTPATVKSYLETIRRKTGAGNRVELTNWWREHNGQGSLPPIGRSPKSGIVVLHAPHYSVAHSAGNVPMPKPMEE